MKSTDRVEDERSEKADVADSAEPLFLRMLGHAAKGTDVNAVPGVIVGELLESTSETHAPCVRYPGQVGSAPVVARSTVELPDVHTARQVVLVFEDGDPAKPIIVGMLRESGRSDVARPSTTLDVEVDGERVVIDAREQLVLRCGGASITLTKAGKVLIQGKYVSSRSAGVNRITGGSVQVN
jgi:hypothetical protein